MDGHARDLLFGKALLVNPLRVLAYSVDVRLCGKSVFYVFHLYISLSLSLYSETHLLEVLVCLAYFYTQEHGQVSRGEAWCHTNRPSRL